MDLFSPFFPPGCRGRREFKHGSMVFVSVGLPTNHSRDRQRSFWLPVAFPLRQECLVTLSLLVRGRRGPVRAGSNMVQGVCFRGTLNQSFS
jgi:hypothetical protein